MPKTRCKAKGIAKMSDPPRPERDEHLIHPVGAQVEAYSLDITPKVSQMPACVESDGSRTLNHVERRASMQGGSHVARNLKAGLTLSYNVRTIGCYAAGWGPHEP